MIDYKDAEAIDNKYRKMRSWINQFKGGYIALLYISTLALLTLTSGDVFYVSCVLFLLVTKNLFMD
jgi:hypothetical protein